MIKEHAIKDLFGILVIVNVNVNIGEYLDYSSCKCKKKLIYSLVEECTENVDETKLVKITVESKNNSRCTSYLVYKVLFFNILHN